MPHTLTPPLILAEYAAGRLAGEFDAVCLFVDTAGFTPLTTALMQHGAEGAEILAQVLVNLFTPLIDIVAQQGGFVAGFAGDAFKAIFPGLTSDSHQRAVTAAWQIRQHLAAQPTQSTRFGDFGFAVKVTVGNGEVTWRIWQGEQGNAPLAQQAGAFFGGAAVEAAMAADPHAKAGEVVLTAAVAAQLPPNVATLAAVDDHFRLLAWPLAVLQEQPAAPLPPAIADTPHDPTTFEFASHFFPADLLTRQTQGEFRQVVTCFVNLRRLPRAEAANTFAADLFRLLAEYGGYLCRIGQSGDKDRGGGTLLLFWGAPTSYEHDVSRALHFLLALQRAAPFPLRAGVTTNLAYAGFVGSPRAEEYTCYSAHVNLAARQMVMAGWGEIWLDAETTRLAGAEFEIASHGDFRFKGFAKTRAVHRLLRQRDLGPENFYQGALVGRQAELAQLQAGLAPLFEGNFAGLITVSGEAGLGKSRLVHELQNRTRWSAPDWQWFLCQTDEVLRQPLNPFRYWLRSYFNQSINAGEATNKVAFASKLNEVLAGLHTEAQNEPEHAAHRTPHAALAAELDRTRSFLGALVDLHWPDSLYGQLEPELRRENTLNALKTLLLAECLRQPVILHVEDSHWLDEESRTFLSRLMHNVAKYPLAVIVTMRPAEETGHNEASRTGWVDGEGLQTIIQLTTLTSVELTALAGAQLQGPPPPALVTLLRERAEGNPFFAEQLSRYLQEQAWLTQGPDGWQLDAEQAAATRLPSGARALLVARLDRLPQPVKEVVQTAAVLGREFDTQVLAHMLAEDTMLAEKLAVADGAAIWSAITQVRYLFRHALLREAAYEMQLRARLRTLHRRAAEALQALFPERLASNYADLAFHYDRAEMAEQAASWYGLAGEQAANSYANETALACFNRALELDQRWEWLKGKVEVLHILGHRPQEASTLEAFIAATGQDTGKQMTAGLLRIAYYEAIGDYAAAQTWIARTQVLAQHLTDRASEAACLNRAGIVAWRQGDYPAAAEAYNAALAIAQAGKFWGAESEARYGLGLVFRQQGKLEEARREFELALSLNTRFGDRQSEARTLNALGSVADMQRNDARALETYRLALEIRESIGDRAGVGTSLYSVALTLSKMGDHSQAEPILHRALQIQQAIGNRWDELLVYNELGILYFMVGDLARARACLEQGLAGSRAIGSGFAEPYLLCNLGQVYRDAGEFAVAVDTLRASLAMAQAQGNVDLEAICEGDLAQTYLRTGDVVLARAEAERSLSLHNALEQPLSTTSVLATIAGAALTLHQHHEALVAAKRALAILDACGGEGPDYPHRDYWNCGQVLAALGETDAAQGARRRAWELLMARAHRISDHAMRRTYLEQIAIHREIAAFSA